MSEPLVARHSAAKVVDRQQGVLLKAARHSLRAAVGIYKKLGHGLTSVECTLKEEWESCHIPSSER